MFDPRRDHSYSTLCTVTVYSALRFLFESIPRFMRESYEFDPRRDHLTSAQCEVWSVECEVIDSS